MAAAAPAVEALRRAHGLDADRLTSLDWFVPRTLLWGNRPVVALVEREGRPVAAVLLYARRQRGMPTGVVKGGNRAGDGVVVAAPELRAAALEAAAAAVLAAAPWVHTVLASLRGAPPWRPDPSPLTGFAAAWHSREVATHLALAGGFEGVLSRMSPRTRRNYRYFRRRGERELGLAFTPALGAAEAQEAVAQLHAESAHPVPRRRALRWEAAIRGTPGAFAMGVRDGAGRWLSYLSGWREREDTFVEWQLNHRGHEAASLSTVMRTYLMEHEAARGAGQIVFVGGTSPALGHYCAPGSCHDLLVTRRGIRGVLARELATWLHPRSEVARLARATE
jgi:hypothetical protein